MKHSRPAISFTRSFSPALKFFLFLFLLVTIVFPLIKMLTSMTGADIRGMFHLPQFRQALINSVVSSGTATFISVAIAYVFAWCIIRTNMGFRELFRVLVSVPMLIPSMAHGMGLVFLLGVNGIITKTFGFSTVIYGFPGIVLGSVLYAFPVAFLMIADILRYEDGSPYEAAEVLGVPHKNQFFSITFPYLRKPLISVFFTVFTMIITDYGVPLMIGGMYLTLPVMMYQEVIGLLNFGRGSVIGSLLLLPAFFAFLLDLFNRDRESQSFVLTLRQKKQNRLRDFFAGTYCLAVCLLVIFPIFVYAVIVFVRKYPVDYSFTFANILKTFNMGAGRYLANSLLVSLGVALSGIVVSYLTAWYTARTKGPSSRILHLVSLTSLTIPGLALGLSYVLFFKGSLLYGTFSILILVNVIHFFASPYLMAYNSLGKINNNLEDVGRTLGINRFFILKDVLIPQTIFTVLEMFSYFFVNSMITISAVSFLATIKSKPLSLMITQFEAQFFPEGAAFISLLILFFNLTIKFTVSILRKFHETFVSPV